MTRRLLPALAIAMLALSAFALNALAAPAPPPLSLGETTPLETTYGDPTLPKARAVWIEMLDSATKTIDIEQFYFSHRPGEALQPLVDAIGKAAARGVRVRLLLDASMGKTYPHPADSLAKLAHVEVRFVDYRALAGGVQHAKFCMIDAREAWLGSQNLDWRSFSHIHELGVRMREPRLAAALEAVFETDWAAAARDQKETPLAATLPQWPLRLVQGPRDTALVWLGASPQKTNPAGLPWDLDLILSRIASAKDTIRVQVMNYGTRVHGMVDSTLQMALIAAANRGVEVRMIVADWGIGGPNEDAWRQLAAVPHIELRISQVPEWSGGYIPFARVEHCKYMVTGDDAWIGTSNWEPSYFLNTRNVGLTLRDAVLADRLKRIFANDWSQPTAVPWRVDSKLAARAHSQTVPAGAKYYGE